MVTSGSTKSNGTLITVAVGVGIAVVSLVAGIVLFVCFRWRCCSRRYKQQHTSEDVRLGKLNLRRFRLGELQKATNCFSRDSLVGSGAFGNVYKGVFSDGEETVLAIKKPHVESYQSVVEFRNEVVLLSRVQHSNLVNLVGYCEQAGLKILVYEYVPNGSLLEYIVGRGKKPLSWIQRVNIAIGAAKGIAYLHEGVQPSIIHRDLKPSNILLGDGFEPKVSDFGLVRTGPIGDASHVSSQIKGTLGYLDPAYCASLHLTPFSDVYSFGVILLQLVTARPAVDTLRPQSQYNVIEWARSSLEKGIVEEILDPNLLLEACNMEMMLKMGLLGLRCVVKSPKDRPTMRQVARELEDALHSAVNINIHKQPSRSSYRSVQREESNAFSIDVVKLEKFDLDTGDYSIESAGMACLDLDSISMDANNSELEGIIEERDGGRETS